MKLDKRTINSLDFGTNLREQVNGFSSLPYKSRLCFKPLVEKMEHFSEFTNETLKQSKETLLHTIRSIPELINPIEDLSILDKHKDIIELILTSVFPMSTRGTDLGRAMPPFSLEPFYITPAFEKLIKGDQMTLTLEKSIYFDDTMVLVHAGLRILDLHYGFKVNFEMPFIFSGTNGRVKRFYKTRAENEFVSLHVIGTPPEVTNETFNHLIKNLFDSELWLKTLPPEHFEFHGMVHAHLIDVTHEEALSRIKQKLLEKDGVLSRENIDELENLLQIFFDTPDLKLGLTAIDYPLENAVLHKFKIRYDFLADEVEQLLIPKYENSIYHRACKYRSELIIEDLVNHPTKTEIETKIIAKGIRSILLVPLIDINDNIIGILEIGHPEAYGFNYFHQFYMEEIKELFKVAMERSRNEVDNQLEAIIREKYTAIHPSVEWKFIRAAYNYMEKGNIDTRTDIEEIVLSDVYPLFGQSDIVGSTRIRNVAIKEDLLKNLKLIREVIKSAINQVAFPLANKYLLDLDDEIKKLNDPKVIVDESKLVHFIHDDLHALLNQLEGLNSKNSTIVDEYYSKLNPKLNLIYQRRKEYENSVTALNGILSSYLENSQKGAQKMIPHYFEKYKTDGIEYDIYIGQSILKHETFDEVQLKNIRLWQLINMCELTRLSEIKGQDLPIPLRTAQLIFVQASPISIRFRSDEKQFDIDGAYNVRYEIIKKRIDKSTIQGTGKRLTVAGKISIVYNAEETRGEYLEYLDYLKSSNFIEDNIEELEIETLQGINGLKALRVTVKIEAEELGKLKIA